MIFINDSSAGDFVKPVECKLFWPGPAKSACRFVILFLAAILSVNLSFAATQNFGEPASADSSINLSQAIKIALSNNNQIKRALLSIKKADQRVRKAYSNLYPEISADASYTRNLELPVFFFPVNPGDPNSPLRAIRIGSDNNWRAGLTVSQKIFDGALFVGISSAEIFKAARAENFRATSQQIVTQTRLAYYNVLLSREILQLENERLERLQENLRVNRARFEAGLADQYSVLQVQVRVSNQKPVVTAARYDLKQTLRNLKLVLGIPVNYSLSVKGDLGTYTILQAEAAAAVNENLKFVSNIGSYKFRNDTTIINIAKEYRGDIRLLEQRIQFAGKKIQAARAEFLPTLSAGYNLNYTAQEPGALNFFGTEMNRVRTQSIFLTLSVPIFDGFRRSAVVQTRIIEKKDLEVQKRIAIREAKNEIETARENLNQAIATADARLKALKLARKGYRRALAQLENGLISQIEVTEAEFQLQQAALNYAQLVYSYLAAKAKYDLAIGMVPFVDKSIPEIE